MQICKAELKDVEAILPKFNAYRTFYKQPLAIDKARQFLTDNLESARSTIFLALDSNGNVIGFTQLYPRLSSVRMVSYIYLSDLYVDEAHRKAGVARALMKAAEKFASETGAASIELQTAHTNVNAQKLYESEGYQIDNDYRTYNLKLPVTAGI